MSGRAKALLEILRQDIAENRVILPSLPEVAFRVRQLTSDPDCSVSRLEHEISKDAAIAARLVKVSNSTAMFRGKRVSSLHQAITHLGFDLVRSLVTQLAILQTMQHPKGDARMRGFVAGSLRISALSHTLAGYQKHLDPEQAALGGLLHDIGKLPLREFLGQRNELTDPQRLHVEQILHPVVGALMLRRWQMPEALVEMARHHEKILRESGHAKADYVDIVIAANLLHYGTESGRYAHYAGLDIPALNKCVHGHAEEQLHQTTEERMALGLTMIDA